MRGFVSIVGAGPGDPDLLTRRAVERLRSADVVFYDGLVPEPVLALAPKAARQRIAKRAGVKTISQAQINSDLITAARLGCRVVRLKAGDPFVLGRGGEEALALADAGVPFEIVPGISSAIAGPALAGIPLTHRGVASGFLVVSGHDRTAYHAVLDSLAPMSITLVVLMGIAAKADLAEYLIARGWDPATPAAILLNSSQPTHAEWIGTLGQLNRIVDLDVSRSPGVIVIGRVVAIRAKEIRNGRSRQSADVRSRPLELRRRG